jgi:HD-GYP domain-containing protein (c-di-GMP phosphodiesterase class II)
MSEVVTRRWASNFVSQLARVLRVSSMHDLHNPIAQAATQEFVALVGRVFDEVDVVTLTEVGEHLYLNGEFVPLTARAKEASRHIRRMFRQIGVSELTIRDRLEPSELQALLGRVQQAVWSKRALEAGQPDAKLDLRVGQGPAAQGDDPEASQLVARAYVHLATLTHQARLVFERGGKVSVPPLRRAVFLLADVSLGREDILLALTRLPNGEADVTLHCTAVAALSLLMGLELGLERAPLANLVMSAVFHELGREQPAMVGPAARVTLEALDELRHRSAWLTSQRIGQHVRSVEAVERASVALECPLSPRGHAEGLIPSMAARVIAVACAYDSLVQPPPPLVGVRADQAVSMLIARGESRVDPTIAALFTTVVGVYPVGSLVQLSGGQLGVVIATTDRHDRPTVKIVQEGGAPADRVVELARDGVGLDIVRCFGPSDAAADVLHLVLA